MNQDNDIDYLLYLSGQKKEFFFEERKKDILNENFEEEVIDAAVENLTTIPIISISSSNIETSLRPNKVSKEDIDVEEIKQEVENLVDAVQNEELENQKEEDVETTYDAVNYELVKHHFNEFLKSAKKLNKTKKKKVKDFLIKNIEKLL